MGIIKYIAGPLIGAVIGYLTNFIAVKMLFYPRKEKYLFGHRIPFTPGAIPKGKARLAGAVGDIVGNTLVTREDIEQQLFSEKIENELCDTIITVLNGRVRNEIISITGISSEKYDENKDKLCILIGNEVLQAVSESDLSDILLEKGADILKEKTSGTMLAMVINDSMIKTLTEPLKEKLRNAIDEKGLDYIKPIIAEKLTNIDGSAGMELLTKINISPTDIRNTIVSTYHKIVVAHADKLMDGLNISAIVEDKINKMSVEELEKLVLEVMKKELNTIVNLGALIGFILGLLNIIF